jgi:glycosyltransferase involved in cell wall biosynthesis
VIILNHIFVLDKIEDPPVTGERKIVIELAKCLVNQGREVYLYSDVKKSKIEGLKTIGLQDLISLSWGKEKTILEYHNTRANAYRRIFWTKFIGNNCAIYAFMGGDLNYILSSKSKLSLKLFEHTIDKIIVVADFQKKLIQDYLNIDVVVIPPFIEQSLVKNNSSLEKDECLKILFMGIPSTNKGIDVLLKSFEQILREYSDAHLIIADSGEIPEASIEAKKLIRHLNFQNNIDYIGIVDALEMLAQVDLFVYPARTLIDTMAIPLSILESLSVGTPAVSANIGGVSEILPEEYIAEPGDDVSLQEAMLNALKKNPPPIPSKFLKHNVLRSYIQLYEMLSK